MVKRRKVSSTGRQCKCRKGYASELDGKCSNCRTKAERRAFEAYHRNTPQIERYNGSNWERIGNTPLDHQLVKEVIDRVLDSPGQRQAEQRNETVGLDLSAEINALERAMGISIESDVKRVFLEPRAASVINPQPEVVKPLKIYAGIGSRETPPEVLGWMEQLGEDLGKAGWILRSGFADGADNAFARGAERSDGPMELYVPWQGFNGAPIDDDRIINVQQFAADVHRHMANVAEHFHPNWKACTAAARNLHTRNVPQICGADMNTPVACVICWTPNGKSGGGTGQAIRIARSLEIPIFDLFNERDREALCIFINNI